MADREVDQVLAYHQRTKHHLHQYASSPGHLDWSTQPDPFRTYAGAPAIDLPLRADSLSISYGDLFRGEVRPQSVELNSIAILFELALGLSAWKQYGTSRWALRCNPSSGNLHPTEGYLVAAALPEVPAGVYHYVSRDHRLERRSTPDIDGAEKLAAILGFDRFMVGLTSIHWREAWKYGERAFRYCQHDAGHAIASFRIAAAALGWSAHLLDTPGDADVAHLLCLDRVDDFAQVSPDDREHPDCLLLVSKEGQDQPNLSAIGAALANATWTGQANPLSPRHVDWPIIDEAARAAWKPASAAAALPETGLQPELLPSSQVPAATLIRQRRSCLSLDGKTSISAEKFFRILDRLLPRTGVPPWDVLPWGPLLHLGIFVHRVDGMNPGLYFLERDPVVHDRIRRLMREAFFWRKPAGCPEHLALYCLAEGDLRQAAQTTSCHQDIAADGAFSLGMVAEFGTVIRQRGPWWYRRLFWESGVLGQMLYLEAEAAGVRGTGIGCYFDDLFHDLLGLQTDDLQSLYHFTVGGPVEDPRLTTLPPYGHLHRGMSGG